MKKNPDRLSKKISDCLSEIIADWLSVLFTDYPTIFRIIQNDVKTSLSEKKLRLPSYWNIFMIYWQFYGWNKKTWYSSSRFHVVNKNSLSLTDGDVTFGAVDRICLKKKIIKISDTNLKLKEKKPLDYTKWLLETLLHEVDLKIVIVILMKIAKVCL